MNKFLRAAVLLPLIVAVAAAGEVSFDQGVDVKAALTLLRATPAGVAAPEAAPAFGRHLHWLAGCRDVTLAAGASRSGPVDLASTEIVEECDGFPAPQCRQTIGDTVRKTARLVIQGRTSRSPETFRFCLMGDDLSVDLTPRYSQTQEGDTLILRPQ